MRATEIAVSFVSPTVVELRLDLGRVRPAIRQDVPPPGTPAPNDEGWVWDDGWIGRVTLDGAWMGLDRYVSSPLDRLFEPRGEPGARFARADDVDRWSVTVDGREVAIESLSRKAAIREDATTGWGEHDYATTQTVFLTLARPIPDGAAVAVDHDHRRFEPVTATFEADAISEAIHVNLLGFEPGDGIKAGWLSSWQGRVADGASEAEGALAAQGWDAPPAWALIDEATGRAVASGTAVLELAADAASTPRTGENFAGAEVWRMDFSEVDAPGAYHLTVEGTGRSQSFEIGAGHWDDVFGVSFSGFYHQRSGIALTDEHTDWTRGRSLHPADGKVTVLETTVRLSDTNQGFRDDLPAGFDLFPDAVTGAVLPRAWGGWHDAGDTDRRAQHLEAVRRLLELDEIAPEWSDRVSADIPEGGGRLPDLVDEALWGLKVFARLQTDEGGVRGGIESPFYWGYGAASDEQEITLYAYAPDAWTSWEFAAAAAKMSHALEDHAPGKAKRWLQKAEAAYAWAEAELDAGGWSALAAVPDEAAADTQRVLENARTIAAVELYRATEDRGYHRDFLDHFAFRRSPDPDHWLSAQHEAAFVYARMDDDLTRDRPAKLAQRAIVREAKVQMEDSDLGFGASGGPWTPYGWESSNQSVDAAANLLIRAHVLTGRDKFLTAAQGDLQYLLGANPQNRTYMTGLDGVRGIDTILHTDADSYGREPPPGITVYGDHDRSEYGTAAEWYMDLMYPSVWPDLGRTPNYETFQAAYDYASSTEYTVQQGIAMTTYASGYLAAEAAGWDGL